MFVISSKCEITRWLRCYTPSPFGYSLYKQRESFYSTMTIVAMLLSKHLYHYLIFSNMYPQIPDGC